MSTRREAVKAAAAELCLAAPMINLGLCGLIGRRYTDEHIRGILGGNFKRVLSDIWDG